jgi:hypothetical protein
MSEEEKPDLVIRTIEIDRDTWGLDGVNVFGTALQQAIGALPRGSRIATIKLTVEAIAPPSVQA